MRSSLGGIPLNEVPWGILVFENSEEGIPLDEVILVGRNFKRGIPFCRYSWVVPFGGVPIEESCLEEFFEESSFAEFPWINTCWSATPYETCIEKREKQASMAKVICDIRAPHCNH